MIPQWLSLVIVSGVSGVALLWLFSKTSNPVKIKRTKKKLQAHLLEMRLYADDPGVILRAQKNLMVQNLRYFALMLKPALAATVPMIALLLILDGYYGKAPLKIGEPAIVTVQMEDAARVNAAPPKLEAPPAIVIETPAVRAVGERQASWRIRPAAEFRGDLRVVANGVSATKSIAAGDGRRFVSSRRVHSIPALLLYPGERPLGAGGIEWIELEYPSASVRMFGIETHWLVWFCIFSLATALVFKSRFKVVI
ncbi:MAG: hypothetical protein KIT09_21110 [Bryobacteraceae bacterium]|nr:hypothetical protein [Bryobacteraceae bacterium]